MISPDIRAMVLDSTRAGVPLDGRGGSARAAGTTVAEVHAAMRDPSEEGRAFARDMAAASEEGAAAMVAAARPVASEAPRVTTWGDVAGASGERAKEEAAAIVRSKRASEATDDGAPDWDSFRELAARKYGPGRTGLYLLQDERLIAHGMPATSPWWRWSIGGFFDSGLTWFVPMVGRGAGKSTNLEKLLLVVVLLTERVVPTGQPWTCPFMSAVERDAVRRIVEIKALLLMAYGIEAKVSGNSIKLKDACGNELEIISTAGTIGQTSGPTTVAAFFDEAAKMHIGNGAANQDAEIIASIVGTSRELEGWVGVRCSSAWETRGAHFANVTEGTDSENFVPTIGVDFIDAALAGYEDVARWESAQGNSHGAAQIRSFAKTLHPGSPNVATWVARPTLTALKSRMKLETLPKDDPTLEGLDRFSYWIREYGSMPLSREGGADYADQCLAAGAMTQALGARMSGRQPMKIEGQPMKVPGARIGDARYAGPPPTHRGHGPLAASWKTRRAI